MLAYSVFLSHYQHNEYCTTQGWPNTKTGGVTVGSSGTPPTEGSEQQQMDVSVLMSHLRGENRISWDVWKTWFNVNQIRNDSIPAKISYL